jgi:hypothetical protein
MRSQVPQLSTESVFKQSGLLIMLYYWSLDIVRVEDKIIGIMFYYHVLGIASV